MFSFSEATSKLERLGSMPRSFCASDATVLALRRLEKFTGSIESYEPFSLLIRRRRPRSILGITLYSLSEGVIEAGRWMAS